ncbi:raffinose synthase family protein [Wolffia australiana]
MEDHTTPPLSITLNDHTFFANGQPFLHDVAPIAAATFALGGAFVGFSGGAAASYHAFPLGRLLNIRFTSLFRFKVWWTTHWTGRHGRDLEHETQFLILEPSMDEARPYVLLLPLIDGSFRASLRAGANDFIEVCVESGSNHVKESSFARTLFVFAAFDPFALVADAMRAIRAEVGGFRLQEEKTVPPVMDKLGWCTWDAFYLKVHPAGVFEGVKGLVEGGCPPGLVLIDDGWQSICHDDDDPAVDSEGMNRTSAGEQMPCRLVKLEENYKFKNYVSKDGESSGLKAFVSDLKAEFGSVEVYVWHALCGYWGGVRPNTIGLPTARMVDPVLSPGLKMTMKDLAVDKIVGNGVGLVPPEKVSELYEGLHRHLASCGITGVKVDVIHILEMLCEDYGGRVELAKAYYKALSDSVKKHFNGNGAIASMEHCNDFFFLGTDIIPLARVGDDCWCSDPAGDPEGAFWLQGCHMVHCAFNSLWMGNFIRPDWDMFQSTHPCATFHAASRSISGGPIYVSDAVGHHDFHLLKRLVFPDGSLLRCERFALPTRDCFFDDPLHDGTTALKIWNLNKCTGVVGAFNCQGGGWCREARQNKSFPEFCNAVKATARPRDVEWSFANPAVSVNDVDLFAVYSSKSGKVSLLRLEEGVEISLQPFDYDLLTFSRLRTVFSSSGVQFAAIGLANMLNSGGAVQSVEMTDGGEVRVGVKGVGEVKAYSSKSPVACRVNGEDVSFMFVDGVVSVNVPWLGSSKPSAVEYIF